MIPIFLAMFFCGDISDESIDDGDDSSYFDIECVIEEEKPTIEEDIRPMFRNQEELKKMLPWLDGPMD